MAEAENWVSELHSENFLAVYDVLIDISKELQFTNDVVIPLFQPMVKFPQLMPGDAVNMRDRYCEIRWKAVHFLKKKGIIESVELLRGSHRWKSGLRIVAEPSRIEEIMQAMQAEYQARTVARKSEPQAPELETAPGPTPIEQLRHLAMRFHSVVIQLRNRYSNRPTLDVSDEYDVQDLLHALLRIYFDDVRPEEWSPSYAGKSARVDFLLKPEQIVIEVKKTRQGLGAKELGDQLILDVARYSKMEDCKILVCLVYDPENRITNPGGLESDLSGRKDGLTVEVIIVPKYY